MVVGLKSCWAASHTNQNGVSGRGFQKLNLTFPKKQMPWLSFRALLGSSSCSAICRTWAFGSLPRGNRALCSCCWLRCERKYVWSFHCKRKVYNVESGPLTSSYVTLTRTPSVRLMFAAYLTSLQQRCPAQQNPPGEACR